MYNERVAGFVTVIAHSTDLPVSGPRRLPIFRYSLRTSIIVTLVAAVGFAHLARQDAKRRQLIAEIEEVGGSVSYDHSLMTLFASQRVAGVRIPYARIEDVGAIRLKDLENLAEISLTDVETVTYDGLRFQSSEMRITTISDEILEGLDSPIESVSFSQP